MITREHYYVRTITKEMTLRPDMIQATPSLPPFLPTEIPRDTPIIDLSHSFLLPFIFDAPSSPFPYHKCLVRCGAWGMTRAGAEGVEAAGAIEEKGIASEIG